MIFVKINPFERGCFFFDVPAGSQPYPSDVVCWCWDALNSKQAMLEVELPSEDIKLNEVGLNQSGKWPHMFGIMKVFFVWSEILDFFEFSIKMYLRGPRF